MGSDAPFDAVKAETDAGRAAGVNQTPWLAVNGVLQAPGALTMDTLRPIIDAELAKVSPAPGASGSPETSATPAP